jgi:hypothetical protein
VKIAHRRPGASWFAIPESDPVDAGYEAEVQQATGRAEREYRQAHARLESAERRLAAAMAQQASAARRKRLAQLQETVDQRRAEVAEYARLMTAPVAADKQIRLRTGLDDHLELGEYKPSAPRRVPAGPVTTTYARKGTDGAREVRGEG